MHDYRTALPPSSDVVIIPPLSLSAVLLAVYSKAVIPIVLEAKLLLAYYTAASSSVPMQLTRTHWPTLGHCHGKETQEQACLHCMSRMDEAQERKVGLQWSRPTFDDIKH